MEILNDPDYLNNPVKPTSPPTTAVPHITVAPTPTVRNRLRNTIIVLATLMIASALFTAYVFIMSSEKIATPSWAQTLLMHYMDGLRYMQPL